VKPLEFPLLSDENIAPDVIAGLRARGCDLRTVGDEQIMGRADIDLLGRATDQGRVIVTHDLAFGRSAIRAGSSFVGIIYLRPGHIAAPFVLAPGRSTPGPSFGSRIGERNGSPSGCSVVRQWTLGVPT
jgi:predicted nuclease of predicted toxin-antitoxin system